MDDVCNAGLATTALLPATSLPLVMAVEIKTHIESLEKKLKFFERKTINQRKRLKKVKKKLGEIEKKINRL